MGLKNYSLCMIDQKLNGMILTSCMAEEAKKKERAEVVGIYVYKV